jgi:hypothetical protein
VPGVKTPALSFYKSKLFKHNINPKHKMETVKDDNQTLAADKDGAAKVFNLSDGREVKIFAGKGKHARNALRVSGKDTEKYLPALMAELVTIGGSKIVMEELDELPLKDYTAIQTSFSQVNF